jgi:hypothetical protein
MNPMKEPLEVKEVIDPNAWTRKEDRLKRLALLVNTRSACTPELMDLDRLGGEIDNPVFTNVAAIIEGEFWSSVLGCC